jgi:hypothetical protein
LKDKLWDVYHACDTSQFLERLRNLQAWAIGQTLPEPILTKILNLSVKASQFTIAYSFPDARHWFRLIEGRKLYWVGIREKRSQYKLRRK